MQIQFLNSSSDTVKIASSDVIPHQGDSVMFTPFNSFDKCTARVNAVELDYDHMVAYVYIGTMMKITK